MAAISATATDGYSCLITAGNATAGNIIGTVEPFEGNTDNLYDVDANSTLPVTVRLFNPTRNVAVTGVPTTGFSAGTLLYFAVSGFASITGTITAGVALQSALLNGDIIEVANIL